MNRELDARIAREIFGHEVQKDKYVPSVLGYPLRVAQISDPEKYFIGETNEHVPRYSSDISSAWSVLNCDKFESWAMRWDNEEKNYITQVQYEGNKYMAYAPSGEESICLAALKSIETKG